MSSNRDFQARREPPDTADLIDRVLDRGIVIDAQYLVNVAGVHLMTLDMWLVTASLETYKSLAGTSAGRALGVALPPWMQGPGAGSPAGP